MCDHPRKPLRHIRCWIQTLLWQYGVYVVSVWSIVANYPVSTHFSRRTDTKHILLQYTCPAMTMNLIWNLNSLNHQTFPRYHGSQRTLQDGLQTWWRIRCNMTTLEDTKPIETNTMLDFSQNTKKGMPQKLHMGTHKLVCKLFVCPPIVQYL